MATLRPGLIDNMIILKVFFNLSFFMYLLDEFSFKKISSYKLYFRSDNYDCIKYCGSKFNVARSKQL